MSGPPTNDVVHPKPRTDLPPGRTLTFDFPGLEIGVAEYEEGPTGCTVFHFPEVASLAIDVRGGSPGINGQHLDVINAICFAGEVLAPGGTLVAGDGLVFAATKSFQR